MIKIALCDDQPVFISILEEAIHDLGVTVNCDFEVKTFTTANEILVAPMDYDILLLDIELDNGQNGLEVGRRLRQRGLIAKIIIVTSHDDYYKEGYKVSPHRYIEKPIKQYEINEAILTAVEMMQNAQRLISIKDRASEVLIPVQQIIIIENKKRKRMLRMWDGISIYVQETSMSWEQLTDQLTLPQFSFVQKSFLVNQDYIRARTIDTVTIDHFGEINISKRYAGEFNKYYQRFVGMED